MADFPKYSQTNKSEGFTKPVSEVGGRLRNPAAADVKNDCRDRVLDLSGKPGNSSVAMVTGRRWTNEQDAALDLSSHGKQTSGQAEALDLSKRNTPPIRPSLSQSHPVSVGILQSHQPLPSRKLLEKALTSGLSSSDFQLGPMSTSHTVSRHTDQSSPVSSDLARPDGIRRTYEGLSIKPFSSSGFKPVGLSMPQVTLPSAGTRLVHAQKPIAITTPQPHNASVNTSRQSDSTTDASLSRSSRDISQGPHDIVQNQGLRQDSNRSLFNMQNLPFSAPGYVIPRPRSGHGMPTSFGAAIDHAVERYVIRRPQQNEQTYQDNSNTSLTRLDAQLGFACPACSKMFKSKAAMKLHMTVHKTLEERQFVCNLCQRRFLHRHHLIVHQRKHSGEKPYKCNACSKSFMAVFLLHKHLRKHTREHGQSNEISSEQLKELHGRRRSGTSNEAMGGFGALGFSGGDGIKMEKPDLVIVSDDDETSVPADAEVRRQNEQLKSHSDVVWNDSPYTSAMPGAFQPSETITGNTTKPNVKPSERMTVNANVEITNIEINSNSVKILTSSVQEKDGNGVKTKFVIKEIEYDTTLTSEKTSDSIGVNDEHIMTDLKGISIPNTKEDINHIPYTLTCREENKKESDLNNKALSGSVDSSKEKPDPWPKYTSEDEIELDYLTGELKILGKAENGEGMMCSESEVTLQESLETPKECGQDGTTLKDVYDTKNHSESVIKIDSEEDCQNKQNKHFEQRPNGEMHAKVEKRNFSIVESDLDTDNCEKRLKVVELDVQLDHSHEGLSSTLSRQHPVLYTCAENSVHRKNKGRRNKSKKKTKKFKCETCSRNFYSQHHLLLHMNTHKRNLALDSLKKAKANQISIAFAQKSGFSCSICNKNFLFKKGLNSHMRVHSSKLAENKLLSRRFRDFMAESSKDSAKNLKPMVNNESHETDEKTACIENENDKAIVDDAVVDEQSNVSERYPKLSDLNIEDKIQVIIGKDKTKRYVCHACNNTYTTKQKLKMHALIHRDNCYLCDMCGRSFFREITLQKHVSTHMLPRPHVCQICQKSFIHRSSLMRHKSVHEAPTAPTMKQQSQDVKFELAMLDTYEMLRKERLEKLQKEKMDVLKIEATQVNLDVMDLSLPRRNDQLTPQKPDEHLQPPTLSPVSMPIPLPSTSVSTIHLSPPNITNVSLLDDRTEIKGIKSEAEMPMNTTELEMKMTSSLSRPRAARSIYADKEERQKTSEITKRPRQRRRKSRVYPTSCRICKEIFSNVIALKSHMAVHNTVETHLYECNVCGHRFTQSCSLLRHMKTSCGDSIDKQNKMQCITCEKVFQRRNAFERHMESHIHGEPPKLNVSLHDTHSDAVENYSPRLFQMNAEQQQVSVETEIKPELEGVLFNGQKTIEKPVLNNNIVLSDEELSEAETIPYGKTSSDESNDGFSDSSETESDNEVQSPKSLPAANSSLSLLSEVCSNLINFEKEKEAEIKKQNELISVQKELETIDILARLSRQNVLTGIKTEKQPFESCSVIKDSLSKPVDGKVYHIPRLPASLIPKQEPIDVEQRNIKRNNEGQENAKIPTVVMDIESEGEKRRKSYFVKMQQRILEGTPRSRSSLNPSTVCTPGQHMPTLKSNSLLAAALFDKGKPEPAHSYKPPVESYVSTINQDMVPTDLSIKKTVQINPLNLSPRSSPLLRETLMSHRQTSNIPQPPPLVPVFKCPNCGQLLYNKTDYRQHMHGHGISPPDSPPQFAQIQPQGPLQIASATPPRPPDTLGRRESATPPRLPDTLGWRESTVGSGSLHTDYTDIKIPSSSSWTVKREPEQHPEQSQRLLKPPSTLNLSPRKYGLSPLAMPSGSKLSSSHSVASTPDIDSPMYSSSDLSDVTLSPVGAMGLNTDILRKELRNKIYARRKSQGLEELTVEFKPPERTEMTDEEREKLQHRRESNRQAAQRSRMRKKDRIVSLLDKI